MPDRAPGCQLASRSRGSRAPLLRYAAAVVLAAALSHPLAAQHDTTSMGAMAGMAHGDATDGAAHEQMSGHLMAGAHMHMTPRTAPLPGDAARAAAIADSLRRAIARYRDTTAAVADGYRMFAPKVRNQRVYHFTSRRNAIRNQFGFDPGRPTSLLYERAADGRLVLVGAMYTAPNSSSMADLDARVPLGVARWHQHVNFCVPRFTQWKRWTDSTDGHPVFGPLSPIATKQSCDAVGGRFHETVFNWMVHAMVERADVWGDEH